MKSFLGPVLALAFGLVLSMAIVATTGESVVSVAKILVMGSVGSWSDLGYTLFYSTPLILTGLSVVWALKVGLFNIGAEGQMTMGGCAAIAFGLQFPGLPIPLAIGGSVVAAFLGGAIWGTVAGWLKASRGTHEVLATILLNFVSYAVAAYLILGPLRNSEAMNPETRPLGEKFWLPTLAENTGPANVVLFIAIAACCLGFFIFRKTIFGFNQQLVGGNLSLARWTGLEAGAQMILAMMVAGGIAGLASLNEVLGYAHKLKEGFTAGAGFGGIAVALIARLNPIAVVPSAILFGALHKGSLDLDLDTEKISRDFALVIQALIIIGFVLYPVLESNFLRLTGTWRRKNG